MTRFDVPEMSCGHCTATIEKAIKAIDPTAKVTCDTGTRKVEVESILNERALSEAIRNAGYNVNTVATI
ncbi:heavy-metal-associated domain-containing protein [Roseovarius sp. Pro17]|uniref:heavy-metal-associated domain-containing protein n=1 Tax=Roseovarius sp. Pro17 TaxID=3108175 RepID=UPI002D765EC1|nr:heavy-metal-associated domain-containing protein [Roseovarius sp. Pro17]